jgi:hypothetical protein
MFGWGVQSPAPPGGMTTTTTMSGAASGPPGGDEITNLAMKVQRLQDQISGLSSHGSNLNQDVQQVVDRIGRELSAQRRSLDEFNSRLESLKRDVEKTSSGAILEQTYVSQTRFAEVHAELKLELRALASKSFSGPADEGFNFRTMGQTISQAMSSAYSAPTSVDLNGLRQEFSNNITQMKQEVFAVKSGMQDMSGRMNDMNAKHQDFNRNIQQCFGYFQDCSMKIQETNAKVFDVKLEFTGQIAEIMQKFREVLTDMDRGMTTAAITTNAGSGFQSGISPQEFQNTIARLEDKLHAARDNGGTVTTAEFARVTAILDGKLNEVASRPAVAADGLTMPSGDVVRQDQLLAAIREVRLEFQERFQEVRAEFKNDNATLNDWLEHTALRAGYLAVAATECTQEEKKELFDSLKAKEKDIAAKTGGDPGLANLSPHYPASLSNIRSSVDELMPNVMQLSAPAIQRPPDRPVFPAEPVTRPNSVLPMMATGDGYVPMSDSMNEETLYITRHPGKVGLSLDGSSGQYLQIQKVNEGLIQSWNLENPYQALNPGDKIYGINSIRGDPQRMIQETGRADSAILTVQVVRANQRVAQPPGMYMPQPRSEFTIRLNIANRKMGLSLDCDDGKTLLITDVKDGPITDWNRSNPAQQVGAGCRILAVNGQSGSPQVLLEETQRGGNIEIKLLRA